MPSQRVGAGDPERAAAGGRDGGEPVDRRVARSRAAVCDAVVDLLVAGGVPAVTVDAVVAQSGVAKTTVYRHWSSRDELLADAAARALPEVEVPDTGSLAGDL